MLALVKLSKLAMRCSRWGIRATEVMPSSTAIFLRSTFRKDMVVDGYFENGQLNSNPKNYVQFAVYNSTIGDL